MNHIPYGKQTIEKDDITAIENSMYEELLTTGPTAKNFESKFASYTGSKYAVAVSSGTAALHLASMVLLKKGDKVLTTPNSFLATSNSILYVDAIPIQKDRSIKAIYGVHFSGNPIDQNKLKNIRDSYNTTVLEDCSHSIGGNYNTKIKVGSCINSDCSIFSFHPVKNITMGEGGVVTTNSKQIYEKLIRLRNHGMTRDINLLNNKEMIYDKKGNLNTWYYEMIELGYNYRITDIQCALGLSQLTKLDRFTNIRRKIAKNYDDAFLKHHNIMPLYPFNENSSYHLYVAKINFKKIKLTRAEFFAKVREKNIGLMVHYIPINKQPYYTNLGYGNEFTPVMEKYYNECVTLPMYPKLTDEEQKYVIKIILENLYEE
jgi:UDP-4-amino-4,6-dideoxy-L-N-acetyl-beta-L-altrosamine transaminase